MEILFATLCGVIYFAAIFYLIFTSKKDEHSVSNLLDDLFFMDDGNIAEEPIELKLGKVSDDNVIEISQDNSGGDWSPHYTGDNIYITSKKQANEMIRVINQLKKELPNEFT